MYSLEELYDIYNDLKNNKVNDLLLPIKKELIYIVSKLNLKDIFILNDLIDSLFILKQENKLDIINQELLDFSKQMGNSSNLVPFILGITFSNDRLTNDIDSNIDNLNNLGISFGCASNALVKDYKNFNYLIKNNVIYTNILTEYTNIRERLLLSSYRKNDLFILLSVLDLISTIVYINIIDYDYDYSLINRCMKEIEDNIIKYFSYFFENNLWCIDIGLFKKSIGGYQNEFITIGNLVNDIYQNKVIKM